jgi:hypothetical protein
MAQTDCTGRLPFRTIGHRTSRVTRAEAKASIGARVAADLLFANLATLELVAEDFGAVTSLSCSPAKPISRPSAFACRPGGGERRRDAVPAQSGAHGHGHKMRARRQEGRSGGRRRAE